MRDKRLGRGVRQGRIWGYMRDPLAGRWHVYMPEKLRSWAGALPTGAWKEKHVLNHLADARSILQDDGYKDYAKFYAPETGGKPRLWGKEEQTAFLWKDGPTNACWAHLRRGFFTTSGSRPNSRSPMSHLTVSPISTTSSATSTVSPPMSTMRRVKR